MADTLVVGNKIRRTRARLPHIKEMISHQETTKRVCEMREAGASLDEIEAALGLSWEIVRPIARRFEREEVLARLQDCTRIAGRETYWSKPCQMPTWVRELVETRP